MNQIVEYLCDKEIYKNRQIAQEIINRQNKKGLRLNVYECKVCKGFHVGQAVGVQINKRLKGHYHRNRQRDTGEYYMKT